MSRVVEEPMVEPVVRALAGAIAVDGGPTPEQRAVLSAIVTGYWGRPDLDLDRLEPLAPDAAAEAITDARHRRRVRELLVLLELCRHPLSEAQVQRVDEYAAAIGESGPGLDAARDLVRSGAEQAMADYQRCVGDVGWVIAEPSLRDTYGGDASDPALAARLRALHDLPAGTLGYEYVEFYVRNGITLPGDDPHMPAMFVAHDMCHVIAGYEPIGQGEIALGAMQLAIADTDPHWIQFLGNLAVHEAGFFSTDTISPKSATLMREGAVDMLAGAFLRGSRCTGDFTAVDHLAMVEQPLAEVRAMFGVPPLEV